jgi:integrase
LYSGYLARLRADCGPLDGLTTGQVEAWLAGHSWAPETLRSAQRAVRGYYRWAATTDRIPADPAAGLPPVREHRGPARPTPDDVWQRACARADSDTLLMLRLAAWCGLRRSEIAAACGEWLEGDMLRVRGKGGTVRLVWCPEQLRRRFARPGPLFIGRWGGCVCPDYVGRRLARIQGPGWSAHNLRHRFACRAYAATGDLAAIQAALGHASPRTTLRYILVPQDHIRAVGIAAAA